MKTLTLLLTGLCLTAALAASAADKPKALVATTPEEAGPDFADQGEYANDWGGAQVIALGEGKFRLVIYKGGLPGAGWDKTTRSEVEGKREGDKIVFATAPNGFNHSLAKGVLTTVSDQGDTYTMNKVNRTSPTLGAKPPKGAVVLFDGTSADAWVNGRMDDRKLLRMGTKTRQSFTNFTLHVEFLLPFMPSARGQGRGNSGVYLQDRYEVQLLDSFGLKGENNECGGLYTKAKPAVNMCFPPLTWQTYDIDFTAAKFDAEGKKTKNAVVTVKHNGVVIHDHFEINGPTGGGKPESPSGGPIQFQDHGNPVFFRNVWLVEK